MKFQRKSRLVCLITFAICWSFTLSVSGQSKLKRPPLIVPEKALPQAAAQTNCANVAALPDIFLEGIEVTGDVPTKDALPNQNFQVTALVENRGQCETGPFIMRIHAVIEDLTAGTKETQVLCDQLVQSIQPTRQRHPEYIHVQCRFQTPGDIYSGHYRFFGIADPENKINEFNEENNSTKDLPLGNAYIEVQRAF
jgi:hypothetical protein